jgi:hypothetical protein
MLMSSALCRFQSIRQKTFAASATRPTAPMSSPAENDAACNFGRHAYEHDNAERGHDDALERGTPRPPDRITRDKV